MSLNHSLLQSQFADSTMLGGRLENVQYASVAANIMVVDSFDVLGDINLAPTSNIIQGNSTITPSKFSNISVINQNLSTSSSPSFITVNASLNGQVSQPTQALITTLPNLANIQGQAIAPSSWTYVNGMDQPVESDSNVNFNSLTIKSTGPNQLLIKKADDTKVVVVDTQTPVVTLYSDLIVNGNVTYNTITQLTTVDPQIGIGSGNLTNSLDLGIYGTHSDDGKTPIYTGLFRDNVTSEWSFYDNQPTEPTTTVANTFTLSNLNLNKLFLSDGNDATPSLSFVNEKNSGIYRASSGVIGISTGGVKLLELSTDGMTIANNILPSLSNTYNLGSAIEYFANAYSTNYFGTLSTGNQPNLSNIGSTGIALTIPSTNITIGTQPVSNSAWQYVNNMDQNVSVSSSPTFVTVTSNLVGNASGSSSTVTSATQSAITTLPNLTSIQGQTISSAKWPLVATMQDVSTSANPAFSSAMLSSNVGNNGTFALQISDTTESKTDKFSIVWSKPFGGLPAFRLQGNVGTGYFNFASGTSTAAFTDVFRYNTAGIDMLTNAISNAGTITSSSFVGNVTGNASGTSATVTSATQSAITTLPNLTSIQSQTISSAKWPLVATMQDISSSASPTFVTVIGNLTGNASTSTAAGTVSNATQSAITTLPNLNSIQSQTISFSKWPLVATMQDVSTASSPTFVTVTGNLTGNASGTSATVTSATQSAITTLPNLTSIQGQTISSAKWPFVSTMDQNVSSSSSPTFANITSGTFTPTISGLFRITSATNASSTYQKIDKVVSVNYYLNTVLPASAIGSDYYMVLTLPITPSSAVSGGFTISGPSGQIGYANASSTSQIQLAWYTTLTQTGGSSYLIINGQYTLP